MKNERNSNLIKLIQIKMVNLFANILICFKGEIDKIELET